MTATSWQLLAAAMFLVAAFSAVTTAQAQLRIGDPAPDFTLASATKDSIDMSGIRLSSAIGKNNIVLAFYPADWSGGCTKEMCTMRDNFSDLSGLGATVLGISGDYVYSHREWGKRLDLPFTLLSDHDHKVAKTYQSYNAQTGYNMRTVYLVDRKGRIAYIDLAYKPGSTESFDSLKNSIQASK